MLREKVLALMFASETPSNFNVFLLCASFDALKVSNGKEF